MRLFIAVHPPPDVQRIAHRAAASLRTSQETVSWVKSADLHYTMRFLGECDAAAEQGAREAMRVAAAAHVRFGAALGGFGAFPTAKRARVLWLGLLQGAEPMRLLATSLEEALVAQGFERSDELFEPHLTVGRVRTPSDWTGPLIEATTPEARFQVDRLSLVRSVLAQGGARHETIAVAGLAEQPSATLPRQP